MAKERLEQIVLGGGCFWGIEAIFKSLKGVRQATPGYVSGVEVVRVLFSPEQLPLHDLLSVFFASHDPTTPERQGNDVGSQYRSAIFYQNDSQGASVESFISELQAAHPAEPRIVTEVRPLEDFTPADPSQRDYYARNQGLPYCQEVIAPKLQKIKENLPEILETKGKVGSKWEGPSYT